jgi:phosphopantetheinyl transferase (holo-ACP synthase)
MALVFKENIAQGTFLGVWKKEEELELLQAVFPLHSEEIEAFDKISNISRKKEWLSTRILLTEMLQKRKLIIYSAYGKPAIHNSELNLSISHSKNFVALIISSQYFPGIDIEHISERVQKIKHKFLTDNEKNWCQNTEQMTACWSAKEAVFKIFEKELDFKDMEASTISLENNQGTFDATLLKKVPGLAVKINYRKFEDDILTYALLRPDLILS